MAGMGHEDQFPRSGTSARCGFSKPTFAGANGNDEDAPLNEPALAGLGASRSARFWQWR
jgi:hypothetical protein